MFTICWGARSSKRRRRAVFSSNRLCVEQFTRKPHLVPALNLHNIREHCFTRILNHSPHPNLQQPRCLVATLISRARIAPEPYSDHLWEGKFCPAAGCCSKQVRWSWRLWSSSCDSSQGLSCGFVNVVTSGACVHTCTYVYMYTHTHKAAPRMRRRLQRLGQCCYAWPMSPCCDSFPEGYADR